jgi:hypothetical protein
VLVASKGGAEEAKTAGLYRLINPKARCSMAERSQLCFLDGVGSLLRKLDLGPKKGRRALILH